MIVIIANDFPPDRGGIQRLMAEIATNLFKRGYVISVVAPFADSSEEFDVTVPYAISRISNIRSTIGRALAFTSKLTHVLKRSRSSATIASSWWPAGAAAAILPARFRGPLIVLAHGSEIAAAHRGARKFLMRWTFQRATVIAANSSYTKSLLSQADVGGRIVLIPLGVDERERRQPRANAPTILSVGRLVPRKGFDRTLEAVAELRKEIPQLVYEIVGNGPQLRDLLELATRLHVQDCVRFLTDVSDEALWAAYDRAWCFSLPTRQVGYDVEGFGMVFLEAAISGTPSIGGKGSGAVDAIVDGVTGLLVDGSSSAEVYRALKALLDDPTLRASMGRAARERALRDFSWARTTDAIVECLGR